MLTESGGSRSLDFGPLAEIASVPEVTDIAVTPQGAVWIDRGKGMEQVTTRIPFRHSADVKEYAIQLCAQLGCRLDDAAPIADAASTDGIRLHAVLEPLVPCGASVSIRLPPPRGHSLTDLENLGFLPHQWVSVMESLVRRKASIVITGGTGTGKTTLLRALLGLCAPTERIVTVEEIREIGGSTRANIVSLVARTRNVEGAGEVSLADLVSATLRMRPDRIVLGECRGAEVADLLRAFNTGHRGGMVTLHASGIDRLPQRLVGLGQLSGLSASSVTFLASGAFDVVLHLERTAGRRRLAQIGVIGVNEAAPGELRLTTDIVAEWKGSGAPVVSAGWASFESQWVAKADP